ncbi:hypothetical protein SAMN06265378_103359 [Paracoccus sediminis]|uniref:Uncharacterized protein n=2 Tax=Paracoccus sediminis TaxID=1214787 RepID=A0A238W4W2_9RHOB|nr:hypothetical protein SAMN06265378_103359 [Paracoccus sediminis]
MLLGSITKFSSSLLGGKSPVPVAAPPAPAQAAPAPRADAPSAGSTPGVIFDLSETAQKAASDALSAPDGGLATTTATAPQSPPSPGMAVAAGIAAVGAVQPAPAPEPRPAAQPATGSGPSSMSANAAIRAKAPDVGTAARSLDKAAADPDEETQARALAIQAQDRSRRQGLAEQLSQAKADPLSALSATSRDNPLDGPSADAAA